MGEDAVLAEAGQVHVLSSMGDLVTSYPVSAGRITAIAATAGDASEADAEAARMIAVGYQEGNLELLHAGKAPSDGALTFERVPASPPVRMLMGPTNTLIVGYANGIVGMWNLLDGAQLADARVHGSATHLMLAGKLLYAASELGQSFVWDLSPFYVNHCDLVRQVWSRTPVVWHGSRPSKLAPPEGHPCLLQP
jgi:hypothetical protein